VSTPVDITGVPDNGEPGTVTVTGMLNLHGVEKEVTAEFDVLRTGNRLVIAGTVPINRIDFGVETPDFVAAKVDEDGELNIRLAMEKH
jgi:probable secreted protein